MPEANGVSKDAPQEAFLARIPGSDVFIQVFAISVALSMAAFITSTKLGGAGIAGPFPWHIVFMSLAWVAFAVLGLHSYSSASDSSKDERRAWHAGYMMCTAVLTVLGWAMIYWAHELFPLGHTGGLEIGAEGVKMNRGFVHAAHVSLGYLVIAAVVMQGGMGWYKRRTLQTTGEKVLGWHGDFGRWVMMPLGLVNVILGIWCLSPRWSVAVQVVFTLCVLVLGALIAVPAAPVKGEEAKLVTEGA
mmetsp:Transcript_131219/g.298756  ORF Transcript_131219/g.298756 Transcript_131219/m.298756 type:complete len:246 (+) Transcript_131219:57-794(+)